MPQFIDFLKTVDAGTVAGVALLAVTILAVIVYRVRKARRKRVPASAGLSPVPVPPPPPRPVVDRFMQRLIAIVLLATALYLIFFKADEASTHFAYTTIGTIVGFYLKG